MARRILFLIAVFVFPVVALAQNDVGIWVNSTLTLALGVRFRM